MVSEQFDPPACSLPSLPRFVDSSSRSVAPAIPKSTSSFRSAAMATTPSHFPIPYAIASPHHTQIHGGYHYPHPPAAYPPPPPGFVPSPAYMPPPAPAYAPPPPVPYPPPAQAYGPFGYYPAAATPPTWPPPALPYAAPLPYLSTPNNGNDNGPFPPTATAAIRDDPAVGCVNNGSLGPCLSSLHEEQGRWQRLDLAQPNAASTAPNRERRPPQPWVESAPSRVLDPRAHKKCDRSCSPASASDLPAPAASHVSSGTKEFQLQRQVAALNHRSLLVINRRLEPQYAQSQSSFDSLQAELSKLRYRLSSLATSMVPSSSSSTSTTERITSVPAMSASSVPAAPAYVAPQVFAEMATPTSEQETQGTTSNFCSGQLNLIQMSCVSNLNEQNLDGMPQSYGFHTLELATPAMENVCSRAPSSIATQAAASLGPGLSSYENDTAGSDLMLVHNVQLPLPVQDGSNMYEKMPVYDIYEEEKPETEQTSKYLRKASENKTHSSHSPMSAIAADLMQFQAFDLLPVFDVYDDETEDCSNEFVDVFAGIPEQLEYEEKQHIGEQAPKCFSKPSENPLPHVVSEFALQDISDVYVPRYTKLGHEQWIQEMSGDVQHLKVYKWSISLIEEGREDWDPGILKTIMKIPSVVNWSSLEGLPHAVNFSPNILLSMIVYAATSIPNILVSFPLHMLWDPGDTILGVLFTSSAGAIKLQCIYAYKSEMLRALLRKPDHVVFDCTLEHQQQLYEDDRPLNDFEKHGDKKIVYGDN